MKKIIILLSLLLALSSCNTDMKKDLEVKNDSKKQEQTEKKQTEKKQNILDKKNGNKTYVGFVGTFCPHCKKEMPILDSFYKEHSKNVNMLMISIDDKKFDGYTIPQKKQSEIEEMTYEKITGEKCGYVPSFVIYDENKKIIEKRCGGALNKEGLEKVLLKKEIPKKVEKKVVEKSKEVKKEITATGATQEKKEISKNIKAIKGSNVRVNYIGKTKKDGKEFDNSYKRGKTLDFKVQNGDMIKGFDDGVVGMKVGDKKTIEIAPKDGYGESNPNAKQVISKEKLADFEKHGIKLEVGSELPINGRNFKIIATDDKNVTIDTNHPLAGKTLIFEVEMVEIK